MTSSAAPFARLETHSSREWKGCFAASLVTWTLLTVGFAGLRVYFLQTKVDSMQQDIVNLSLTMAALRRATVQNVSRLAKDSAKLQQEVFNLSRDLDQKAAAANVTVLQREVAQKASAQSVAQLQAQVDACLQNLSRLEVVVRGKASLGDVSSKANETTLDTVREKLAAAEAQLVSTPRFADLPVMPNLLQDTKHFHGLCHGRVGVETPWADAWSSPWSYVNSGGTAVDVASSTVEVVDMTTQASAESAGLWPLGALSASQGGLLLDNFYGADLRALLLTVRTLPAADQGALGVIQQGCPTYTSWSVGSFTTEVGVFVNVLEHTGNIQLFFASNAGAGVLIEGPGAQGWQYLHNSQAGWGGCQQSFIRGVGRMRVAIALPYQSFGNHSGVPVWAGFDPSFFLGNS